MAQMKGTYLENYLESIATLPAEIRRNFALMRELDARSNELIEKIDKAIKVYSVNGKRAAREVIDDRAAKQTRQELKACLEFGDEKVALAIQTYELVDKHIRRLDTDLKKFEAELDAEDKKKLSNYNFESKTKDKGKGRGKPDSDSIPMTPSHTSTTAQTPTRKKGEAGTGSGATGSLLDARVLNVDIDMPIDPNEPTYCVCNRVSFGEMVGCDNPDCKVEWFHFECVGLTNPPKGKWYCPDCRKKVVKKVKK